MVAFKIVYDDNAGQRGSGRMVIRFILTSCFLLVFLQMVSSFWPEGKAILQAVLIPGDPKMTMEAAEAFAQELSAGFSLTDAVHNFCDAVMKYAS